jgi:hypothetical protein
MEDAIDRFVKEIVFGVAVALFPIWHGVRVIVAGSTTIIGSHGDRLHLSGLDAIAVGVFFLGLGAAIHFYCFWRSRQQFQTLGRIGTYIACLTAMVALIFVVCKVLARLFL